MIEMFEDCKIIRHGVKNKTIRLLCKCKQIENTLMRINFFDKIQYGVAFSIS